MRKMMNVVVAALFAVSASAQSSAKPKPEIGLTLIPPSPVTDQIMLDIRGAVRNNGDATKQFEVAVYLDEEDPGKPLHRETIAVAPKSAAGVKFRWPTKDQAGKHKILLVAISGPEIRRASRPMEILRSEVRSTRRVDGAWCSFNLPEMSEGKLYDPDLRRMTNDQWREMVRGMHAIGMDIFVIQESVHNHLHYGRHRIAQEGYKGKAFYPSSLVSARMPMAADDPIEAILDEADKVGMQVFSGVANYAWFDFSPASLAWHKQVADELWGRYAHHPSFYGWYVGEEKAGDLGNAVERQEIVEFFKEFTAYVHRIAPDKPVMLAPNCFNLPGAEATYRQLLPHVDILCPFGFHRLPERGQTGEQAAALLQSLCDETGAHLWMDMEVFLFNEQGALIPRPIGGLLSDLLRFPNFEKIICYQYPGLLTAPDASIKPGGDAPVKLYLDYKKYMEMGLEAFQLRHAARGAAVNLSSPPSPKYPGRHGAASLTDGETGETDYLSPAWLGFQGDDVVAVIDLRQSVPINELEAQFLQFSPGGIFLPAQVEFAVGDTPASLHQVKTVMPGLPLREAGPAVSAFAARDLKVEGRYVQVRATNIGKIPTGHPAAGANAWVFVDEVMVNPARARQ